MTESKHEHHEALLHQVRGTPDGEVTVETCRCGYERRTTKTATSVEWCPWSPPPSPTSTK